MVGLDGYTKLVKRVKLLGASVDVTHYTLSLGAADGTTGLYAKSFSGGTTIEMPIFSRAAQSMLTGMGIYITLDAVGCTTTAVVDGDEIKDAANNYYRVDYVKPHYIGDQLIFREAGLTYLPLRSLL